MINSHPVFVLVIAAIGPQSVSSAMSATPPIQNLHPIRVVHAHRLERVQGTSLRPCMFFPGVLIMWLNLLVGSVAAVATSTLGRVGGRRE